MNLRTPVEIKSKEYPKINHNHSILSLGSCFSEHIGDKLVQAKLDCTVNPYGVLYNPLSIETAIREMCSEKLYLEDDLFLYNGEWHSWMHHGSFSALRKEDILDKINSRLQQIREKLHNLDYLFITFGSAWVYKRIEDGAVVSNCHKVPNKQFRREKLSVPEIVEVYKTLIKDIQEISPQLKIIFSVSPIRHISDGLHQNQLSKATLLLAIDALEQLFPDSIFYFPSYEIVLDELRDYRFFADDMAHPSFLAVDYIWEKFRQTFFLKDTDSLISQCEQISKSMAHRPSNPKSPAYVSFLEHLVIKMEQISRNNTKLEFRKEINQCHIQLKKLRE